MPSSSEPRSDTPLLAKVLIASVAALVLHIFVGWGWTILGGVFAGVWVVRWGGVVGACAVGLEWLLLVAYNFVVAGREVSTMAAVLGGILGNLPGAVIVAITLLIGALLGGLGGIIGSNLVRVFRPSQADVPV